MLRSLDNPTIEQLAYEAGLNASAGSVTGTATKVIVDRFIAIYDHLAGSIFDRKVLNSLYPDTNARTFTLQNLTFEQKRFKEKAEKLGYLNITGAQVPSPNGLIGSLFDYSSVLADHTEFGDRVLKSLTMLYKQLAAIHNSDDLLRSASTVGKLASIDVHEKYRAQLNSKLQKCIGPTAANTEVPYGNLVRNNKEMFQVFDHRNVFEKAVDEKTKNEIEDLVYRIGNLMEGFANRITDESEEANGKVVSALSSCLYQCGQMVRDYGSYLFRINTLIGVVDGVVVQVLKYTPEHMKEVLEEAANKERSAGNNNDGDHPSLKQQVDQIHEEELTETDINNLLIEIDKTDLDSEQERLERLTVVRDRIESRGTISQADIEEVDRAAPGLLDDIISRHTFTQIPSTAGLTPALNAMSSGQQKGIFALGIAFLVAIIAIIGKVISMIKKPGTDPKNVAQAAEVANTKIQEIKTVTPQEAVANVKENVAPATTKSNSGESKPTSAAASAPTSSPSSAPSVPASEPAKPAPKVYDPEPDIKVLKGAWQSVHGESLDVEKWATQPTMIHVHKSEKSDKIKSRYYLLHHTNTRDKVYETLKSSIGLMLNNLDIYRKSLSSAETFVSIVTNKKAQDSNTDNRAAYWAEGTKYLLNLMDVAYAYGNDVKHQPWIDAASTAEFKFMGDEKLNNLLDANATLLTNTTVTLEEVKKKCEDLIADYEKLSPDAINFTKKAKEEKQKLLAAKAYADADTKAMLQNLQLRLGLIANIKKFDEEFKGYILASKSALVAQANLIKSYKK